MGKVAEMNRSSLSVTGLEVMLFKRGKTNSARCFFRRDEWTRTGVVIFDLPRENLILQCNLEEPLISNQLKTVYNHSNKPMRVPDL